MRRRAGHGATVAAAALLALAACGGGEMASERPEALPVGSATDVSPPPAAPSRPEVREGTITLAGMTEPMTYRLYRSPAGFALPFSTYLPADMQAEGASRGEDEAVRFVTAFGGARNERAFVQLTVHPAGTTLAEARERFAAASGASAEVPAGERAYPWALEERAGQSAGTIRHGALGEHAGRYFLLLAEYPAEMGDGMGPRIAEIVREWRWTAGDRPLGSGE
jgi:hypothetical protein